MVDSIASGKRIGRQRKAMSISADKQTFSRSRYICSLRSLFPLKINWKITATLKIILFSTFRLSMQSFARKETTKRRRWMEKLEHMYLKREMYTERFEKREKLDEITLTMRGDREKLMRHSQWEREREREREKKHDDVVRRGKHVLSRKSTFLSLLLVRRVIGTSWLFVVLRVFFFFFFFFTSMVLLLFASTHSMLNV